MDLLGKQDYCKDIIKSTSSFSSPTPCRAKNMGWMSVSEGWQLGKGSLCSGALTPHVSHTSPACCRSIPLMQNPIVQQDTRFVLHLRYSHPPPPLPTGTHCLRWMDAGCCCCCNTEVLRELPEPSESQSAAECAEPQVE